LIIIKIHLFTRAEVIPMVYSSQKNKSWL